MTRMRSYDLTCSCGIKFQADLYDTVNVTLDPELKDLILDGKINVITYYVSPTKSLQLHGQYGWGAGAARYFDTTPQVVGYEVSMMAGGARAHSSKEDT